MSKITRKALVPATTNLNPKTPTKSRAHGKPVAGKAGKVKSPAVSSAALATSLVEAARSRLKTLKGDVRNVSVLSEDEVLSEVTEFISTGFPHIDAIMGGGFAVGRASEVFGPEGAGKTALTHCAVRANQVAGGTPIFIDFELSLDPDKLERLGIDPDRMVYCTPSCVEEAWDLIWTFMAELRKNPPKVPTLIVWDSVAQSVPRAELEEKDSGKQHMGLVAKSMAKGCRKMLRAIASVRAHMLWVNQERVPVGINAAYQEKKTVGGDSVRYACSQRLRVLRVSTLKRGGKEGPATGYLVKVITKKNRCAPPQQSGTWVLDFRRGPDLAQSLFVAMKDLKMIKKGAGSTYTSKVLPHLEPFTKSAWRIHIRDVTNMGLVTDALAEALNAKYIASTSEEEPEAEDLNDDPGADDDTPGDGPADDPET